MRSCKRFPKLVCWSVLFGRTNATIITFWLAAFHQFDAIFYANPIQFDSFLDWQSIECEELREKKYFCCWIYNQNKSKQKNQINITKYNKTFFALRPCFVYIYNFHHCCSHWRCISSFFFSVSGFRSFWQKFMFNANRFTNVERSHEWKFMKQNAIGTNISTIYFYTKKNFLASNFQMLLEYSDAYIYGYAMTQNGTSAWTFW